MKLSGLEDTRGVRRTLSNTRDLTLMSLIHTSSRPFPEPTNHNTLPLDLRPSTGVSHWLRSERKEGDIPAAHLHNNGGICLWAFERMELAESILDWRQRPGAWTPHTRRRKRKSTLLVTLLLWFITHPPKPKPLELVYLFSTQKELSVCLFSGQAVVNFDGIICTLALCSMEL